MLKNRNKAQLYETLKILYKNEEKAYLAYSTISLRDNISSTLPEIISTVIGVTGFSDTDITDCYYRVRSSFEQYKMDYHIISQEDPAWPQGIQEGEYPVRFLYAYGNVSLLGNKRITVTGMRLPSLQGKDDAVKICQDANEKGVTILSTLEQGINHLVLSLCLKFGNFPIALLSTPLHQCNPESSRELMVRIANEGGLLLTRFSPAEKSEKWFSVPRNRLLVKMTKNLVVVEEKDGGPEWLIADMVSKNDGKIMLFNSSVTNPNYTGAKKAAEESNVVIYNKQGDLKKLISVTKSRTKKQEASDLNQLKLFP